MIGKHEYPTDKLQQCTKSSLQVAMQIFPKHNPEKIQHLLQSVSLFCLNLILVSYSFIFFVHLQATKNKLFKYNWCNIQNQEWSFACVGHFHSIPFPCCGFVFES